MCVNLIDPFLLDTSEGIKKSSGVSEFCPNSKLGPDYRGSTLLKNNPPQSVVNSDTAPTPVSLIILDHLAVKADLLQGLLKHKRLIRLIQKQSAITRPTAHQILNINPLHQIQIAVKKVDLARRLIKQNHTQFGVEQKLGRLDFNRTNHRAEPRIQYIQMGAREPIVAS